MQRAGFGHHPGYSQTDERAASRQGDLAGRAWPLLYPIVDRLAPSVTARGRSGSTELAEVLALVPRENLFSSHSQI
jgi:hypothetical protein